MSDASDRGRSLLQLAISLRLAAQRLAESASRMQQCATNQREYLERLNLLRDRIVELLAMCRRLSGDEAPLPQQPRPCPTNPASRATTPPARTRLPASAFVEFSNWQEFEKFRHMPPISDQELASCNIDELIRRLNAGPGAVGSGS